MAMWLDNIYLGLGALWIFIIAIKGFSVAILIKLCYIYLERTNDFA